MRWIIWTFLYAPMHTHSKCACAKVSSCQPFSWCKQTEEDEFFVRTDSYLLNFLLSKHLKMLIIWHAQSMVVSYIILVSGIACHLLNKMKTLLVSWKYARKVWGRYQLIAKYEKMEKNWPKQGHISGRIAFFRWILPGLEFHKACYTNMSISKRRLLI